MIRRWLRWWRDLWNREVRPALAPRETFGDAVNNVRDLPRRDDRNGLEWPED